MLLQPNDTQTPMRDEHCLVFRDENISVFVSQSYIFIFVLVVVAANTLIWCNGHSVFTTLLLSEAVAAAALPSSVKLHMSIYLGCNESAEQREKQNFLSNDTPHCSHCVLSLPYL